MKLFHKYFVGFAIGNNYIKTCAETGDINSAVSSCGEYACCSVNLNRAVGRDGCAVYGDGAVGVIGDVAYSCLRVQGQLIDAERA